MAVTAPVLEVGRFAVEDIPERRVTIVAGAAKHSEVAIQLTGEEHTITVEGQKCILTLIKFLKVKSVSNANSWTMITITPCNPVSIFNPCHT